MLVIPAVDLMGGLCVRLVRGAGRGRVYGSPLEWLERFADRGARAVHIVDLDAALGLGRNTQLVLELARRASEAGVEVQVGGGLRSYGDAALLLDRGVDRVVIATMAFERTEEAERLIREYGGERVVIALDLREGGRVVVRGWRREAASLEEAVELASRLGARYVLATAVGRDGTLGGYGGAPRALLSRFRVIVAGGISSLADLRRAARDGAWGAVVGRALYEGLISLYELGRMGWEVAGQEDNTVPRR